jgi:hypothetical protein
VVAPAGKRRRLVGRRQTGNRALAAGRRRGRQGRGRGRRLALRHHRGAAVEQADGDELPRIRPKIANQPRRKARSVSDTAPTIQDAISADVQL